jgi:tetrahydromethanopterin S-methyltransferase subunit F
MTAIDDNDIDKNINLTVEDVMMRNQVLAMRSRELESRVSELEAELESVRKRVKIFGRRISSTYIVLYDHDGYYNPETKSGNLEGLASVVSDALRILSGSEDANADR